MFLQIHNFHTFFFRLEEREGEVGEVAMQVGELATQEVGEEALESNSLPTTIAAGSRCQVGRVKSSFLPKDHSKPQQSMAI